MARRDGEAVRAGVSSVGPALVGRAAERDRLLAAVAAPPAVIVVEGEAGIGKSRLVAELSSAMPQPAPKPRNSAAGMRLLVGSCRRLREPFPLGPVVEAVRGRAVDLAGVPLSPVVGALRPLLPELSEVLPPALEPLDDRAAQRHRVFRGVVELLRALGPCVLVLEDVHWADGQTVDLLSYLLPEPPEGLSVVLTYRGDEVDPAVRALTARTTPAVRREHLVLSALDAAGTGELAAATLGVPRVSTVFAEYLCQRASGLPLAVQELVALLKARGSLAWREGRWARKAVAQLDVPPGIRDPVRERVARLSPAARAVLEAAAVLQVPVPAPVLRATASTVAAEGLAEALDSTLLRETGSGVGFRHVLAAEAVYDDLSPSRRQELHHAAAEAVRAQDPVPLGQLAHHLRHAGRLEEWVAVAERAAARAVALGDDAQAVALLEGVVRDAPLAVSERGRLAVLLARAASDSFQYRPDIPELLVEVLVADQPREIRGELMFLRYGPLGDTDSDQVARRRELASCLADLDGRPDLRVWAMIALGVPRGGARADEYRHWLYRALAELPQVADPVFASFALGKVLMVLLSVGDPIWRCLLTQFLARTGARPRHHRETSAYASLALEAATAGQHAVAAALATSTGAGAAVADSELERRVAKARAMADLCRGAWDRLPQPSPDAAGFSGPDEEAFDNGVLGGFRQVRAGDIDGAWRRLGAAVRHFGSAAWLGTLPLPLAMFARLAVARGDLDPVLSMVDGYRDAVAAHGVWPPAARVVPPLTEVLVAAGRRADAVELVDWYARGVAGRDAALAPAALDHARGHCATPGEKPALFAAAAGAYAEAHAPYEAAQCQELAAAAGFAVREPGAGAALAEALAGYRRLGARWDLDRAVALARRNGVPVPAAHRGGPKGYGSGLTRREREVAELAGTGRTNREIAEVLFLSPNTVDKHLVAAMRKLGVHSRTALAHQLHAGDGQ